MVDGHIAKLASNCGPQTNGDVKEPDFSPQESAEVKLRVERRVNVGGQRNAHVTNTSARYVSGKLTTFETSTFQPDNITLLCLQPAPPQKKKKPVIFRFTVLAQVDFFAHIPKLARPRSCTEGLILKNYVFPRLT